MEIYEIYGIYGELHTSLLLRQWCKLFRSRSGCVVFQVISILMKGNSTERPSRSSLPHFFVTEFERMSVKDRVLEIYRNALS